ncbi:NAD(P)H-dependent oxidoreductase [Bacteroidota bacterium]
MKIVVLNGSPKGKYSITVQYVNYLQKKFTEHEFQVLHISQKIKKIENDENYFNEIINEIKKSDVVIWSFGLWVLAVPAQYMRFIELIKERNALSAFKGKYAAAISTSIQFYDHTAHNYIRSVCEDMVMQYIEGISFYILDFMKEEKRYDLFIFFENIHWTIENKLQTTRLYSPLVFKDFVYKPTNTVVKNYTNKTILILTDNYDKKTNLGKMIDRFTDSYHNKPEIIDLRDINIKGACLGCMKCGYEYKCHYNDGYADFYNNKVRNADILVFAGEMKDRYLSSMWKTFFDRAFFWNHTPSLKDKQIIYIISGPISQNPNLQQIFEGNVTARQSANLVDIISDESANSTIIDATLQRVAELAVVYADKKFVPPENILGVGGHKIFRDEIFGHLRGVRQADHKYFKKNGLYDFEQKKIGLRIINFFLLQACKFPSFRKKYYNNIMKFPSKRFGELTDKLFHQNQPVSA